VPRYHLSLVWPHSGYAPPPDLSRPELRAAFDAGRANRAVEGDPAAQLERWHQLRKGDPRVMAAYWAGCREDLGGPLPLALDVLLIGVSAVAACAIRQPSSPFRRVAGAIALVASVATFMRSERRGGRSGLTAETAPVPYPPTSMLLQFGIDALYRLWTSRRHGRHFRSPSIEAAAAITRTVMRRRSWRASLPAKST
jgi:hypothetical protein